MYVYGVPYMYVWNDSEKKMYNVIMILEQQMDTL